MAIMNTYSKIFMNLKGIKWAIKRTQWKLLQMLGGMF